MNVRVLFTYPARSWLGLDGGKTAKGLQIVVSVEWPKMVFDKRARLLDSIIARSNGCIYPPKDVTKVFLENGFPEEVEESIAELKRVMDHTEEAD